MWALLSVPRKVGPTGGTPRPRSTFRPVMAASAVLIDAICSLGLHGAATHHSDAAHPVRDSRAVVREQTAHQVEDAERRIGRGLELRGRAVVHAEVGVEGALETRHSGEATTTISDAIVAVDREVVAHGVDDQVGLGRRVAHDRGQAVHEERDGGLDLLDVLEVADGHL